MFQPGRHHRDDTLVHLGLGLLVPGFLTLISKYVPESDLDFEIREIAKRLGKPIRSINVTGNSQAIRAAFINTRDLMITSGLIENTTAEEMEFLIVRAMTAGATANKAVLAFIVGYVFASVLVAALVILHPDQMRSLVPLWVFVGISAILVSGLGYRWLKHSIESDAAALRYCPNLEVAEQAIAKTVLGAKATAYDRDEFIRSSPRIRQLQEAAARLQANEGLARQPYLKQKA